MARGGVAPRDSGPGCEAAHGRRPVRALRLAQALRGGDRRGGRPAGPGADGGSRLRSRSLRGSRKLARCLRAAGIRPGDTPHERPGLHPRKPRQRPRAGVGRTHRKLAGDAAGPSHHGDGRGPDPDSLASRVRAGSRGPVPLAGRGSARRTRLGPAAARRLAALLAPGRRTLSELRTDLGRAARLPTRAAAHGAQARSGAPAHRRRRRGGQDDRGPAHRPRAFRPRRHRPHRRPLPAAPRGPMGHRAGGPLPYPRRSGYRPEHAAPGAGHPAGSKHLHGVPAHGGQPRLREDQREKRPLPPGVSRLRHRRRGSHVCLRRPAPASAARVASGSGRQRGAAPCPAHRDSAQRR